MKFSPVFMDLIPVAPVVEKTLELSTVLLIAGAVLVAAGLMILAIKKNKK